MKKSILTIIIIAFLLMGTFGFVVQASSDEDKIIEWILILMPNMISKYGGGGSAFWLDAGNDLQPDPSFAVNVNVSAGNLSVFDTVFVGNGANEINMTFTGTNLEVGGNLNITQNLYVDGCIKYNCKQAGGCVTLGTCL